MRIDWSYRDRAIIPNRIISVGTGHEYPKAALALAVVSVALKMAVAVWVALQFIRGEHIAWTTLALMVAIGARQYSRDLYPR